MLQLRDEAVRTRKLLIHQDDMLRNTIWLSILLKQNAFRELIRQPFNAKKITLLISKIQIATIANCFK